MLVDAIIDVIEVADADKRGHDHNGEGPELRNRRMAEDRQRHGAQQHEHDRNHAEQGGVDDIDLARSFSERGLARSRGNIAPFGRGRHASGRDDGMPDIIACFVHT